jgi:hypothetical protein
MGGPNRTTAEPGDPTATETPGLELRSWGEEREEAGGEELFRELSAFPWERNGGGARGAERTSWWRFWGGDGERMEIWAVRGCGMHIFLGEIRETKNGSFTLAWAIFSLFYEIF